MSVHVPCIDDKATILDGFFWILYASHEEWIMAFVPSVDEERISVRLSLTRFFARSGRVAACLTCCPIMRARGGGGTP